MGKVFSCLLFQVKNYANVAMKKSRIKLKLSKLLQNIDTDEANDPDYFYTEDNDIG